MCGLCGGDFVVTRTHVIAELVLKRLIEAPSCSSPVSSCLELIDDFAPTVYDELTKLLQAL